MSDKQPILRAWVRSLPLALVVPLVACAQQLGGIQGDPTTRPVVARHVPAPSAARETVVRTKLSKAQEDPATASAASPSRNTRQAAAPEASARTITVGPDGDVRTIAQAAKIARDGDTVEVRAGHYSGDVALWTQKRLTIRAVGGRAVLDAAGKSVGGKGIWVIRNGQFEVEGFDFVGARVPDRNGAGIRFEHGSLVVRDCRFLDNENGILTSNDRKSTLVVEKSLFSGNGDGRGYAHGLYAGLIARLEVRGSWFRNGRVGQLLKTRAQESVIEYNRITDEEGNSSYELEFPSGGRAVVVGNIIEQSAKTQNRVIVSYGVEGYKWPVNELVMSHNTLVNRRLNGGTFVRVSAGAAEPVLLYNVWAGPGAFELGVPAREEGNVRVPLDALPDAASGNYRLSASAAEEVEPAPSSAQWSPKAQYVQERSLEALKNAPLLPGAVQP